MLQQRIEAKWIDVFCQAFTLCGVHAGESAAILSETQSRPVNVQLAEFALLRLGARADPMRSYLAARIDRDAYAVSHIGWGMNPQARWDAMAFYEKNDFNGTELRADLA